MKRRPRSIFRTRKLRSGVIYTGPHWVGPSQPHYMQIIDAVARQADQLEPGAMSIIHVGHDDWCSHFAGGCCDCNPVGFLQSLGPALEE